MTESVESPLLRSTLNSLGRRPDGEPGWLARLRGEAADRLRTQGFPKPKDEAWRFTPIRPLTRIAFRSDAPAPQATVPPADASACLHNGRAHPSGAPPDGVFVGSLADALATHPDLVQAHLGQTASASDGFAAANAALLSDALVIVVQAGAVVQRPIHVLRVNEATDHPTASSSRILLALGAGAQACVVETVQRNGTERHLDNSVTEVVLAGGARLRHLRFRSGQSDSYVVEATGIRQERDSSYESQAITLGGALTRFSTEVRLEGNGAECSLDGLFLADSNELVDHHTHLVHAVAHCQSRQLYKGIVTGTGTGVFDGIVVVAPGAQATEAHQQSQNLVLSPDAVLHTKPHLEIDADDVRCSHGATVGRLDANQLFYLRSRGIDEETARAALTYGFAQDILERIPFEELRATVREAVLARLPGGDLARELSA